MNDDHDTKTISYSIDETNRIRESLGLKPLNVTINTTKSIESTNHSSKNSSTRAIDNEEKEKNIQGGNVSDFSQECEDNQFPTKNEVSASKLLLKIENNKYKRARDELISTRSLGEMIKDEENDENSEMNIFEWVKRMRKRDKEKEVLASQNSNLDSHNSNESDSIETKVNNQGTSVLRVTHDLKNLSHNESIILTIKDKNILTDRGELDLTNDMDDFENIYEVEKEKRRKFDDIKKKSNVVYDPAQAYIDQNIAEINSEQACGSNLDNSNELKPIMNSSNVYYYDKDTKNQFINEKFKAENLSNDILPQYDDIITEFEKKQGKHTIKAKNEEKGLIIDIKAHINDNPEDHYLSDLIDIAKKNKRSDDSVSSISLHSNLDDSKFQSNQHKAGIDQSLIEAYKINYDNNMSIIAGHGSAIIEKIKKKKNQSKRRKNIDGDDELAALEQAVPWNQIFSINKMSSTNQIDDHGNRDAKSHNMEIYKTNENLTKEEISDNMTDLDKNKSNSFFEERELVIKRAKENEKALLALEGDEDEADKLLYDQIAKQRRLIQLKKSGSRVKADVFVVEAIENTQQTKPTFENNFPAESFIVKSDASEPVQLTRTTEFCRYVLSPEEKLELLRSEIKFKEDTEFKSTDPKVVQNSEVSTNDLDSDEESELNAMRETPLDGGLASALSYLKNKKDLDLDSCRIGRINKDNAPLHKSTLKGDIKLDYKDQYGRVMNPKEAFRHISWVFHGKGPGKKKLEKHLKTLELDRKVKENPIDALPTIRALRKIQHDDKKPYIVLTGGKVAS